MCLEYGRQFLQRPLRFVGAALFVTFLLIMQSAMLSERASAHTGSVQTLTTNLVPRPSSSTVFGQAVTFTATASCQAACHSPTQPHNLGIIVQFSDNGSLLGTSTVGTNTSSYNSPSFSAALQYAKLLAGTHSISAVFTPADTDFKIPNATATQTVSKSGTTTSPPSSSANPSLPGQSVTFGVTVSVVAPGAGTPTGTVTFEDGGNVLGTGNLSGSTASFTTNQLTVGCHFITAIYGGDANFSGSTSQPLTQAVNSCSAGHDFNGDGKSDILWRDTGGNVATWLMNGAQVTQSSGVGNASTAWSILGQRDFDGNGKSDILWHDTSGNVAIWFMNGTQLIQSAGVGNVPTAWSIVGTGDFNGDGKSDVLWRNTSGAVAVWLMNGTQLIQSVGVGNVPTTWSIAGTGDFNGDGKSDILWHDTSGNVAIWFMNGAQLIQSAGVGNVPTTWSIVGTGDFNGDSKSDVLWHDTSGNVAIWLMNGAQVTQSAGVGSVPTSWSIVETGDFNGDGKSDVLWHDTSGNVAIWFMNGTRPTQSAGVGNAPTVWSIQGTGAD